VKARYLWTIFFGVIIAIFLALIIDRVIGGGTPATPPIAKDSDAPQSEILEANELISPAIFSGVAEVEGLLQLTGTGAPNASLSIVDGITRLRQIRVDNEGVWRMNVDVNNDTMMELRLQMFSPDGIEIAADNSVFRVPFPAQFLPKPSKVTGERLSETLNVPALILLTAPGGASQLIQSPFGGVPSDKGLTLGPIDYDDSGGVVLSGRSTEPGRIRIYLNEVAIGEISVEPSGRWTYIGGEALPVGSYDISAELIRDGQAISRVTVPFQRLSPSQAQSPDETFVKFEPLRWQLRRALLGGGAQYTVIFAPDGSTALPVPQAN